MRVTACRICNGRTIIPILDLGMMPIPNHFPENDTEIRSEELYPLRFCLCGDCRLALLDEVVAPEKLFSTYHYLTSASSPLIPHFRSLAQEAKERFDLPDGALIFDIGANDGTLLREFQRLGMSVLGVDPARNVATIARTKGITVLPEFFSTHLARRVRDEWGSFDLITATNVFAHTNDISDFAAGVRHLLKPRGVFVAEFAHLLEMIDKRFFDVIYHEHLSFFALEPLLTFFSQHGLRIFDVKKVLTQGGSLRIYVSRAENTAHAATPNIAAVIEEERSRGLHERATYETFAQHVRDYRMSLRTLLQTLKQQGKRIVGVGAPAKGVILLNYCRIDGSLLDYLVDSTPLKQHRRMPGVHIPVYPEEKLAEDPVDYVLLLAYNFKTEILQKLTPYIERGTKVIVPFPEIHVVDQAPLIGERVARSLKSPKLAHTVPREREV